MSNTLKLLLKKLLMMTKKQRLFVASPNTPNVLQAMMQLEQAKNHAKVANKVTLEAEKEKNVAEKEVEELKRQLQPK